MENVIISNLSKLKDLKNRFKDGGVEKFHVISDFDRTLTKAFVDGKKFPSVISVLRDGNYLTADYAEKAHALFNKYHPIEIDSDIPLEEKKKAMHEWWTTHFRLLIKSGLNRKDLEKIVESGKIRFREGALEFIDFLYKNKIPLIILSSSGLGKDSISVLLEKEGRAYDNVHIVSNSFVWDKKGNAVAVEEPIIHSFNKSETSVNRLPFFSLIKNRKNVLLLGDGIGDIGMINGFSYENLIKIGFLNYDVKESLEEFKENFDIVILNDGNFKYVNKLIKEII
ncbi:MAG: hypothetical protein ISS82_05450 [Nanoarchaeota archaeon]|nr:hypothetical protein [Nanoarchaeota archaeon]